MAKVSFTHQPHDFCHRDLAAKYINKEYLSNAWTHFFKNMNLFLKGNFIALV